VDDDKTLPRIHHTQDNFDDDMDLVEGVLEIGESPNSNAIESQVWGQSYAHLFDIVPNHEPPDAVKQQRNVTDAIEGQRRKRQTWQRSKQFKKLATVWEIPAQDSASLSPSSLEALLNSADQPSVLRPLTIHRVDSTDDADDEDSDSDSSDASSDSPSEASFHCEDLPDRVQPPAPLRANFLDDEDSHSSDECNASHSAALSQGSQHFADQPHPLQPFTSRRTDFLHEDSEDDVAPPQSPTYSSVGSLYSMPVPTVVGNLHGLFDNAIWHHEPSLPLGDLSTSSADPLPDLDVFHAVEAEVVALIIYMVDCITHHRFDDLTELGSDLRWAANTIASDFPGWSLLERYGEAIEFLLAQVAILGTH
jgi:hypothetical protein